MRAGLALSILQRPVQSAGAGAANRGIPLPSSCRGPLYRPRARLLRIQNHLLPVPRVTPWACRADARASSTVMAHASSGTVSGAGDGLTDAAKLADADLPPVKDDAVPWLERIEGSIARSRKIRGGNYVQIATVSPEGLPCCRTVVFRGWVPSASGQKAMKMITDLRSEKVGQIAASPACEMVWWFSKSSEQYRISGELQLVGADCTDQELLNQRKQQWGNLSDPAREQFFWESPGVPFSGHPEPPVGGRDAEGNVLTAPDTFLLMLLWPKKVKYLRLTDNFAQADQLDAACAAWSCQRVNP
mmetsp:Transcript_11841/g.24874  ORF Transcript_11841/g.24874 Transcript_11841/m.24874 type:complete len:302 (-) Transcript_11841:376-1281(-)